jgi:hypothetical protein
VPTLIAIWLFVLWRHMALRIIVRIIKGKPTASEFTGIIVDIFELTVVLYLAADVVFFVEDFVAVDAVCIFVRFGSGGPGGSGGGGFSYL